MVSVYIYSLVRIKFCYPKISLYVHINTLCHTWLFFTSSYCQFLTHYTTIKLKRSRVLRRWHCIHYRCWRSRGLRWRTDLWMFLDNDAGTLVVRLPGLKKAHMVMFFLVYMFSDWYKTESMITVVTVDSFFFFIWALSKRRCNVWSWAYFLPHAWKVGRTRVVVLAAGISGK